MMRDFVRRGQIFTAICLDERGFEEFAMNTYKRFFEKRRVELGDKDVLERMALYREFVTDVVEEDFFRMGMKDAIMVKRWAREWELFYSPDEFVDEVMAMFSEEDFE